MENYIVRIYRRDAADPNKVAGIFESVERQTENSFTSLNSLLSLLARAPAAGRGPDDAAASTAKPERTDRSIKIE
jgi:hypothetical protein